MFACIIDGVRDRTKQQLRIVAVLRVLQKTNVLRIKRNKQREGSSGTV